MKTITILGGIVVLAAGMMYFIPSTQEFVSEKIVEVEMVKEVDALEKRISEAVEAAKASTTAKAQAAYEAVIEQEKARIELEVRQSYRKELEKEEIELEQKTGF